MMRKTRNRDGRVPRPRSLVLMAVLLLAMGAASSTVAVGDAAAATCDHPAQALDLANWKLQLPLTRQGGSGIVEITQPSLGSFTKAPYFTSDPANCGAGVTFRAPVNGEHTPGSIFARAELREMSGGTPASWSSTSGTHTFNETIAFLATPNDKPDVVGAQIHNAAEDITLLALRGTNLYLSNGDDPTAKLVTSNYKLGTPVDLKWVVSGGVTKAYVDGVLQLSFNRAYAGAYFKAGAYPQANCDSSAPCTSTNYGSTRITKLSVCHSAGTAASSASDGSADDETDDEGTDDQ